MIGGFRLASGLEIFVSPHALKETTERLFPESKHRSKRIRKKLIKRFGGEFRKVPAIFRTPAGVVAHPALYAEIVTAAAKEQNLARWYGPTSMPEGVYAGEAPDEAVPERSGPRTTRLGPV